MPPTAAQTTSAPMPLENLSCAIAWIAEITDTSPAEVKRRLQQEQQGLGSNVQDELRRRNVPPFVFGEALERFYAESDAFLYECFTWNRHATKAKMRRWILAFLQRQYPTAARVLTFGDGLGFDSAALALAGHRVTYFEVGQRNVAFARKVFARNDVQVDVVTRPEELAAGSFDVAICLDVLEHVPDPPALVRQLSGYLRPAGHLLVHAPFWFVHPAVSTHLAANRKYSGEFQRLYGAAGLHAVAGALAWNPLALQKAASAESGTPPMPLPMRAKLLLGGLLLKAARWWNWPLVSVAQGLFALERYRGRDLRKIA